MSKEKSREINNKVNLFQQIMGILIIFFMFNIFFIDRILHILLPHKEHSKFKTWSKDLANVKYTVARLFIFMLPIIIFKIFF